MMNKKRILVVGMRMGIFAFMQSEFPEHEIVNVTDVESDFFKKHIQKPIKFELTELEPLPNCEFTKHDMDDLHHAPKQKMYNKALNNYNKRRFKV